MPSRRRVRKGSFAAPIEELVQLFPDSQPTSPSQPHQRSRKLQEKLDIHALLFERAWHLDL